jgi:hypothetical protein
MDDVEAADLKTLALSRPPLTEDRLQQLMAYQRALIEAGAFHKGNLAAAHQAALGHTTLDVADIELWTNVAREYCGKRWTLRLLERRQAELEAQKAMGPLSGQDAAKLTGIQKERFRVGDLTPLRVRYGDAAFALLQAHEEELLALHEKLRALSCF